MSLPFSTTDIFELKKHKFNEICLEMFHWQAKNNDIYHEFLTLLKIDSSSIFDLNHIPFMPIEFFKNHRVKTGNWRHSTIFESSSTTDSTPSTHFVGDIEWYETSFMNHFEMNYGSPHKWSILALLPNYLERENSSLVYMIDHLLKQSQYSNSGFYLYNHTHLKSAIEENERKNIPTLLWGVSFALLDFSELISKKYKCLTIMETGGMKGRRKEITRTELHQQLTSAFGNVPIHSEYGMTELFSQAYSKKDGKFVCPPWMKIMVRRFDNALENARLGSSGLINVIDLANIQTCSFIATQDVGRLFKDGTFEVLGRFDHSEQRGCNLMVV
ncbi:MAG: acyl transferase [Flavobacteriales bacterium]|nr:acyl transferase [Flavobacteriales bacterium]